jgi:hypothetical protein
MSDRITEVLDRIEARQQADVGLVEGTNALDFLQSIYRNTDVSLSVRMRAAALALPFESPKLAVTAYIAEDNFAERLERALARSAKVPKVIEATPTGAVSRSTK